jgi:hypothetical protein
MSWMFSKRMPMGVSTGVIGTYSPSHDGVSSPSSFWSKRGGLPVDDDAAPAAVLKAPQCPKRLVPDHHDCVRLALALHVLERSAGDDVLEYMLSNRKATQDTGTTSEGANKR